jgi:NADPH-dependent curcumin reductase CurA
MNRRIVLAQRPQSAASLDSFRMETTAVPDLSAGQVLLRTMWLSLDSYMRGRMSDAPSCDLTRLPTGLSRPSWALEDVVHGLENAPHAFMGSLSGRNFGKLVVDLEDPHGVRV